MAEHDLTLVPLTADAPPASWTAADPEAFGVDAEVLLVRAASGGYRPTISIGRFPSADAADPMMIADETVADSSGATLVDREIGEGFVAQIVALPARGHDLRLAETILRWEAPRPSLADTCIVARLICDSAELDVVGAEFQLLVASLEPDLD